MTTDTFEALDVSAHMPPEDIPEVAEVKKRITDVAKKYTERHGWCDEVTRALEEAGIIAEQPIRVNVDLGLLGVPVVTVNPSDLHGKTAKQQAKVLAKRIDGATVRVGRSRTDYTAKDIEGFVKGITVHEENPAMASSEPRSAWMILPNGSTAHLFRDFHSTSSDNSRYVSTACQSYGDYTGNLKEPTVSTRKCGTCSRREQGR